MTIGIATILPNTVILVADGREVFFKQNLIATDKKNKLVNIKNSFVLIPNGISEITEYAIKFIKLNYKVSFDIKQTCKLIDTSLRISWQKNIHLMPQDINLNHEKIHASFLVGGLIKNEPFICGFAHKYNYSESYYIALEPVDFLIACPDRTKAEKFYENQLIKGFNKNRIVNENSELINEIIKCSVNTTRFMEKDEFLIGGTVRYAVIQANQFYFESEYEEAV